MPVTVGSRLGSHEILGLLGAGGMGEVFLAQDTKLNRRVAIKVLPDAAAGDPDRLARFHREAQAVAALNHPGIAAIYDLAESGGTNFLVLELIDGDTLAERLRRGAMPIAEAVAVSLQILHALEAAHEKGICHRDLKPANIKLTSSGTVKVLDFGLAKFLRARAEARSDDSTIVVDETSPGMVLGTAGYMAPEQARGHEADERSDIFSFGCICYEMLCGRRAFDGDTASDSLASVLKSEVDLSRLPAGVPPRLIEILKGCLEKDPQQRWHAAADVRLQIASVGDGIPHAAGGEVRKLSWMQATAVAAAAIVATLTAGYVAWTRTPEPPRPVTRFTVPLPEGQQFSHVGRLVLAVSPDGKSLVYVANRRLYLRPLDGFESSVIPGSELPDGLQGPVFSPDGQSIAFRSVGDSLLKRIPVSGGAPVTIGPNPSPFGLSWNDHGILFGQYGTGILRVAPEGGKPEVVIPVPEDETADGPQLLSGDNVLFSVRKNTDSWDQGQIVVQSMAGGPRKVVVNGGAAAVYIPTGHLVYAVGNVLFAVPFDVRRLTVTGGAVSILEGVNRGGGGPRSSATAQFVISNTGSLAFVPGTRGVSPRDDLVDLALFDRTSAPKRLGLRPARYGAPRVSPDSKWAAVEQESASGVDIWLVDLIGTAPIRRLTFGGKNRAPIWLGDSWVVFQSDDSSGPGLFRQRADGSGTAERLTSAAAGIIHVPQSASPDGDHVLVTKVEAGRQSLWVLSLKDRQMVSFGGVQAPLVQAAFSPDGRWVAYFTGTLPQGKQDFGSASFVRPFPATGATFEIPGPIGGAARPVWARSGDAIFFGAGLGRDAVIPVVTAPRFEFGKPEVFPLGARVESPPDVRRNVDPVGDGRLLGLMPAASDPAAANPVPRIAVVLNWFDELRAKVR